MPAGGGAGRPPPPNRTTGGEHRRKGPSQPPSDAHGPTAGKQCTAPRLDPTTPWLLVTPPWLHRNAPAGRESRPVHTSPGSGWTRSSGPFAPITGEGPFPPHPT